MTAGATNIPFAPAEAAGRLGGYAPMRLGQRVPPFSDPAWHYEFAFSGERTLAEFGRGLATLSSRGADSSDCFAEVSVALATLPGGPHIVDGAVCVLDEFGRSDRPRLAARARQRRWRADSDPVVYCVFDLLVHNGSDVTAKPLRERKRLLAKLLRAMPPSLALVDGISGQGERLYEQAVAKEFEGIIAKRLDSPYRPGVHSDDWLAIERQSAGARR